MLGDDPLYPHPSSLFAYAHLGSEVKMRKGSGTSIIVDNYCEKWNGADNAGGSGWMEAKVVTSRDELHHYSEGLFGSDVETEVELDGEEGDGGVEVSGYRRSRAGDERVGYAMSERERTMMAAPSNQGAQDGKAKRAKRFIGVPWWIEMLEYVPVAGRMVSHFPGESGKMTRGYRIRRLDGCADGLLARTLLPLVAANGAR
jgi:hypothetical protein